MLLSADYAIFKSLLFRMTCSWSRGVTVSTLDSESSDRDSNPREAFLALAAQEVNNTASHIKAQAGTAWIVSVLIILRPEDPRNREDSSR